MIEKEISQYIFLNLAKKKLINLKKVKVTQRVRDLKYKNNSLFLFFDEPSAIGLISLN